MPLAITGLVLLIAFAVCYWCGRALAQHYQDGPEAIAVLGIGACVLGGLMLFNGTIDAGWARVGLALAAGVGLMTGYRRPAPLG